MSKREATLIQFENRVHGMLDKEHSRQLDREEEELRKKIDEAKKELGQFENNILFFAHADEKNPIVREARKNIERQREYVDLLVSKLKMMRKLQKQASEPETKPQDIPTENKA